uniref:Uncharacterized protein n=1 Tax=Arundo donax TaxID=35708 RepID=A0A0A9EE26_ARUDO
MREGGGAAGGWGQDGRERPSASGQVSGGDPIKTKWIMRGVFSGGFGLVSLAFSGR